MHPVLLFVLIAYAVFVAVLAVMLLTRDRSEKPRQKQEPVAAKPPAPSPTVTTPPAFTPAYMSGDYARPIRHTPARRAHAPQPQQSGMSVTDAFIIGAVIGSFDSCSHHDSSGGYCDDGGNWCC
jgi:hypothetical protein